MSRFLRAWAAAGACALAVAARAASLGEMTVLSARGEPLRARIAVEPSGLGRLDGARVRLTPPDEQRRLGIAPLEHPPITLALRRDGTGKAWIEIRSQAPIRRSYLRIVVDAWFPPSLITREYAALIARPGGRGWTAMTPHRTLLLPGLPPQWVQARPGGATPEEAVLATAQDAVRAAPAPHRRPQQSPAPRPPAVTSPQPPALPAEPAPRPAGPAARVAAPPEGEATGQVAADGRGSIGWIVALSLAAGAAIGALFLALWRWGLEPGHRPPPRERLAAWARRVGALAADTSSRIGGARARLAALRAAAAAPGRRQQVGTVAHEPAAPVAAHEAEDSDTGGSDTGGEVPPAPEPVTDGLETEAVEEVPDDALIDDGGIHRAGEDRRGPARPPQDADGRYTADDRMAGIPDQIAMAEVCLEQGDLEGAETYLSDVLAASSASAYARAQAERLLERIARPGAGRQVG